MSKILIAGCGELGSRFLQAAVSLNEITEINIIEPHGKARETARSRMLQMGRDMSTVSVNWFNDLSIAGSHEDMVVIATQADVRLDVFEKALKAGYRKFLVEKIVTQSAYDYQCMMQLARKHNAKVWVNCKTRNYPIWEYIKAKINPVEQLTYHSIGGNHGICTNGLHTIDLFVFLTEASAIEVKETMFDKKLHLTKRGKYDISGQIIIEIETNKSVLVMNYTESHMQMPVDFLMTKDYRWIVDNSTRQAFESSVSEKTPFKPIPFEGDVSVSAMSKKFISDILENDNCELPTLDDCWLAHKSVFEATLPFFNEVLGKNDNFCPIT